jgi:SAM-dependent methyltransferase
MPEPTLKSFAPLHDDYAFFERHVSESEATLAAWLPLVQNRWSAPKALDFGAGSGSFTSKFLERAAFGPRLQLTLVEPDDGFRSQAQRALAGFCDTPIRVWPLLDRDLGPSFDLIFSHHVLYYVPNLEQTLARLCAALRPDGRMLLVQGGDGNGMNQLVFAAFAKLGAQSPYNYSESTHTLLRDLGVPLRVQAISSVLDFPDSREGRLRILRFLLGEHLARLSQEEALALFDHFRHGDRIRIESRDELFVVEAP